MKACFSKRHQVVVATQSRQLAHLICRHSLSLLSLPDLVPRISNSTVIYRSLRRCHSTIHDVAMLFRQILHDLSFLSPQNKRCHQSPRSFNGLLGKKRVEFPVLQVLLLGVDGLGFLVKQILKLAFLLVEDLWHDEGKQRDEFTEVVL